MLRRSSMLSIAGVPSVRLPHWSVCRRVVKTDSMYCKEMSIADARLGKGIDLVSSGMR